MLFRSERKAGDDIVITPFPVAEKYDEKNISHFETIKEVISNIRNLRVKFNASPKTELMLQIQSGPHLEFLPYVKLINKLSNLSAVEVTEKFDETYAQFMVGTTEFRLSVENTVSAEDEIILIEKEINYHEGFLITIRAKLTNDRFVNSAPANVVEKERQKEQDALDKLKVLKLRLETLKQ